MKFVFGQKYTIHKADAYQEWFDEQQGRDQAQILDRLSSIEEDGYFGTHKFLEDEIWELKWLNGRRIYYVYIKKLDIVLLLGGNKNGQSKDITKAKKIFKKYSSPKG